MQASQHAKSLLPIGTYVKFELDIQTHDRYRRLLAYVYLPDSEMLNAMLVKEGYAQVMTIPPNVRYKDLFLRLEKEAREKSKKPWEEDITEMVMGGHCYSYSYLFRTDII